MKNNVIHCVRAAEVYSGPETFRVSIQYGVTFHTGHEHDT